MMFRAFFVLLFVTMIIVSCSVPQDATTCAKVNYSPRIWKRHTGQEPSKRGRLFSKDAQQSRKTKRSAKRAEKGEKKEKDKSKAGKRWQLFRRNKDASKDAQDQDKGTFKQNDRKQKKERRKRSKHPQMGLWPNGHPG